MTDSRRSEAIESPFSVLVVGSGAREHALVLALSESPSVSEIWASPGNPGMCFLAKCLDYPVSEVEAIADWAEERGIGLVVVGPEAPLAAGLADLLQARGVAVFGPTRAAAELEWSKAFAKEFMVRHGIPTADSGAFTDPESALEYLAKSAFPVVVKADGLAAGKGVLICHDAMEAEAAIRSILVERAFGDAGNQVIIEEFLQGRELSVIALVDGERLAILPLARDYKRLGDGDEGPNTGGMGSFSPVEEIDSLLLENIREAVLEPTVKGMREEGRPYRGALYAGLMLTQDGPKVLEFNCRFGDPETQVILPLLESDLAATLLQCAQGQLDPDSITTRTLAATCIVLAAPGYPEQPRTGAAITGIEAAEESGALVFHAGTAERDGQLVTGGGRVLSVVATGESLDAARSAAYEAAQRIAFPGMQLRMDIAQSPDTSPA